VPFSQNAQCRSQNTFYESINFDVSDYFSP
jgi:hypothetical protein